MDSANTTDLHAKNLANQMNIFLALHALPLIHAMWTKDINTLAMLDHMQRLRDSDDYAACATLLTFLFTIADRPIPPELPDIVNDPAARDLMVDVNTAAENGE